MKKVSMAVMALFMIVGVTMAQGPRGGQRGMDAKQRAEKMTEYMVKEYGLSDTQQQQLLEVNLAMAEKMGNRQAAGSRMHHGKKPQPCECACACKEKGKETKDKKVAEGEKEKKATRAERPERRESADRKDRPDRPERPQLSKEDVEKHRQEMKAIRDSYQAQLQQIMTPEQYQAYSQKQTERELRMKERVEKAREARRTQKEG